MLMIFIRVVDKVSFPSFMDWEEKLCLKLFQVDGKLGKVLEATLTNLL